MIQKLLDATKSAIVIGHWPKWFSDAEKVLADDAVKIIEKLVYAIPGIGPFLALPIISFLSDMAISAVIQVLVKDFDRLVFATWVAIRTGRKIEDYIDAKKDGDVDAIDQAGDAVIHLGNQ